MPNTYTQLYIQIVFAVQGRKNVIDEHFRDRLVKYICGIISNNKCKPLSIYCNPDHTHILKGLNPTISISELVRDIKANSSKWLNKNKLVNGKFRWQEGFGAFSYSRSQINAVTKYILNQPIHHKRTSFILRKAEVDFNEQYLFVWYD